MVIKVNNLSLRIHEIEKEKDQLYHENIELAK